MRGLSTVSQKEDGDFSVGTLTTRGFLQPGKVSKHKGKGPPRTLIPDLSAQSVLQHPHLPASVVSSEVNVPDYTLEQLC